MCQASIPVELNDQLLNAGEDRQAVEAVGTQWSYKQARELLESGAPGIHLYILNRANSAVTLIEQLKADGLINR